MKLSRTSPGVCCGCLLLLLCVWGDGLAAQTQPNADADLAAKVQQLNDAIAKTQAQVAESQRQLNELKQQVRTLQQVMQARKAESPASAPVADPAQAAKTSASEDAQEHEAMQDSQLATLQQIKVESDSKYPLRLSGLILFNSFVNAENVDNVTAPTLAIPGAGSTAFTLRQTILGLDARGPHVAGASSYADVRMDFAALPAQSGATGIYSGNYGATTGLLRLRTAHAGLTWPHAEAYVSLDRPIINPDSPTSLAAVAEPALAWSGNMWMWNPQAGVRWTLPAGERDRVGVEAAVIDVADAPLTPQFYVSTQAAGPSSNEFSRWPGAEARLSWSVGNGERNNHIGVGGYFAAHRYPSQQMNSWAATLDAHWRLPARVEFSGNFYRGLGLGGLGGGAYKDYAFRSAGSYRDFTALDDAGGWAELKERVSERLQFNEAFGTDQLFNGELREYSPVLTTTYQRLARNQTFTANTIYSPSAYLLFSLEYRHILSSPVAGGSIGSNVVGIAAGYKF